MPELPEVETIVRTLAPRLAGGRIVEARFFSRLVLRSRPEQVAARLQGRTIRALRRHGKFLLLELSGGLWLAIHLGMTGKLLWEGTAGPYTRAVFTLDRGTLFYDDIRQFGRIELGESIPSRIARLGPDPLSVSEADFASRLRRHRGRIKPLLLNQAFLRGLGNIYTDEALFRAGIHPRAVVARMGGERVRRLYRAIQDVLGAAIESGGSSISDYVDAAGRPGTFQFQHQVYGRKGLPCAVCGTPIRRIVLAQRGTHYCPKCQRV